MPGLGPNATVNNASLSPPLFAMSGLPGLTRGSSDRPAFEAASFAGVRLSSSRHRPAVGPNVNVIGSNDVVQQATINWVSVMTFNPGVGAAPNETTIAANPGLPVPTPTPLILSFCTTALLP